MTPHDFIAKWKKGGDERRDFQPFFEDLCRLLGRKTPREADPDHTWFTYEYGAAKTSGGNGWADVWRKGCFGWEAKGTHKDLDRAYQQLKMYADALENPPLLIVSDLQRFQIHTNFTATTKQVHAFTVEDLADPKTRALLLAAFDDPQQLRPGVTRAAITEEAAGLFAELADALRKRGFAAHAVAHFLNRLLFCMFAEDIGLLPEHIFTRLVESAQGAPDKFAKRSEELFAAMKEGGDFALHSIDWFNGGLFDDAATVRLETPELSTLRHAAKLDWSQIDPSIFGTLFERGLDPAKRSQLGAHYTDPATILKIVEPVVTAPLLMRWNEQKTQIEALMKKADIFGKPGGTETERAAWLKGMAARTKAHNEALAKLSAFLDQLRNFRILDPACGSGNFLFVALRALKDLEQRVMFEAETLGLPRQAPGISPANVCGIELNEYAAELARITVWIGEIQWMIANGYGARRNPILQTLGGIENRDALLNADGSEAAWPAADVIIGNPPFIGDKKMRRELGDEYVDALRSTYEGRVPGGADFVCYWFEKAREKIAIGATQAAGFVSTNSIRGGANRKVLDRIVETTRIFLAYSDQEWWDDQGAGVRVSLTAFGKHAGSPKLDGVDVAEIFADLTASEGVNLTKIVALAENAGVAFSGITKKGAFDIDGEEARKLLIAGGNPNGRPNHDVVFPWRNGDAIGGRDADKWIVNFGELGEIDSSLYNDPFSIVKIRVKPQRDKTNDKNERKNWWKLARRAPDMFKSIAQLDRFIVTPEVSKNRIFAWLEKDVIADKNLVVIARDDDTTFGILHSRFHELWSIRTGTSLVNIPRYTSSTTFRTFPFPNGLTPRDTAKAPSHAAAIAQAAKTLTEARDRWLNPVEWVDWTRTPEEATAGFPLRPIAKPGFEAALKKRTLTHLYNERPTWLANLHFHLDKAVAAAYGWEWPLDDDEILKRLFTLNQTRA